MSHETDVSQVAVQSAKHDLLLWVAASQLPMQALGEVGGFEDCYLVADGRILDKAKPFAVQVSPPSCRVLLKQLKLGYCGHSLASTFFCNNCQNSNCCIKATCLALHYHRRQLALSVNPNLPTRVIAFQIKVTSLQSVRKELGSAAIGNSLTKKLDKLRQMLLSLSCQCTLFDNVVVSQLVNQSPLQFTRLNFYFRRTFPTDRPSIVHQLFGMSVGTPLFPLFKLIFRVEYKLFELLISRVIVSPSLSRLKNNLQLQQSLFRTKIELALSRLSRVQLQPTISCESSTCSSVEVDSLQSQKVQDFSYRLVLPKDKFSRVLEYVKKRLMEFGTLGQYINFAMSPRGGSEMISAKLVLNSKMASEDDINSFLEYSNARQEIDIVLREHQNIRQQFGQVYDRFVASQAYKKSKQFLQQQQIFEKKMKKLEENSNPLDIVFCVDYTASMIPFLQGVRLTITQIANNYGKKYPHTSIKFGLVAYRDHSDKAVTQKLQLCSQQQLLKRMEELRAYGGYDRYEAVVDGLSEVYSLKFRLNSIRFVFHICDSPPHGRQFHFDSNDSKNDSFPEGCPCQNTFQQVARRYSQLNLYFCFLPVRKLTKTKKFLERLFKDRFCFDTYEIEKPLDLRSKIVEHIKEKRQQIMRLKAGLRERMVVSLELIIKGILTEIKQFYAYLRLSDSVQKKRLYSDQLNAFIGQLQGLKEKADSQSLREGALLTQQVLAEVRAKRTAILEQGLAILSQSLN